VIGKMGAKVNHGSNGCHMTISLNFIIYEKFLNSFTFNNSISEILEIIKSIPIKINA
jgi:hypothetical protein